MPLPFPSQSILHTAFSLPSPITNQSSPGKSTEQSTKPQANLFPAWSAVDDVKSKAGSLSNEAQKEIHKASEAAQANAGKLELYSTKVCL